jgi:putative DNA-invertase from lambdoid prophage Rac
MLDGPNWNKSTTEHCLAKSPAAWMPGTTATLWPGPVQEKAPGSQSSSRSTTASSGHKPSSFTRAERHSAMGEKRAFPKLKSPKVFGHPSHRGKTRSRVGLYARVSTQDQQPIPMQTRTLREYATRRGWTIALQVKEIGSGASQRERREQLLEAARRRDIDVVLVWRLDRWGRSVTDLLATLQELEHLGVGFVSLTEALNLTTPAGRAMAGLLAVFAEFEREILRERVRAGLAHARQNGQRLGRPVTAGLHADEVRKLYRAGRSKSATARRLKIGRTSVRRMLSAKGR